MSAVLSDTPLPVRFKLTVEQYHRMAELGILREDERVELLDGELIAMPAIGSLHGGLVSRLTRLLVQRGGDRVVVSPQNSLILSDVSEPQPDFAVLQWRADDYTSRTPAAANALLVIEVSDSTLRYDRDVKRRFYAEAGVREFWVIDVHARQILVHRDPAGQLYRSAQTLTVGDTAVCQALPQISIGVDELFAGVG